MADHQFDDFFCQIVSLKKKTDYEKELYLGTIGNPFCGCLL